MASVVFLLHVTTKAIGSFSFAERAIVGEKGVVDPQNLLTMYTSFITFQVYAWLTA